MMQQQPLQKTLPHLPKGMKMPESNTGGMAPHMPGKKLPTWTDEQNTQAAPTMEGQGQRESRREQKQPAHAAAASSSASQQQMILHDEKTEEEPAPVFSAPAKRGLSLRRGNAVQQQVYRMDAGIKPVELLVERLMAWRGATKNLVRLFKAIQEIEHKSAQGYCKTTQIVQVPFKDWQGHFMESGGIQDVWNAFRNYSMEQSVLHQDYVNYLDRSVIPSLRNIKQDIKNLVKAITRDKNLRSSNLYDGRMQVDHLVSKLDRVIQADSQQPDNAFQHDDPLLLNCAVFQACKSLYDQENMLHSNVFNLQKEVGMFEHNIVHNLRIICERFKEFRLQNSNESHRVIGQITSTFKDVSPDTEWNEFVRRNQSSLISENAAYKTEDDISYPNQHHDLVQPIKVGFLERKSMMRGWNRGLYVLTPAGFLHGYKSPEQFDANPMRAECSVFIPHTNINCTKNYDTMYHQNLFEIRGKNHQAMMGRERGFVFRAQDASELQDWFDKLIQISERFRPVPLLKGTEEQRALPGLPQDDGQQQSQYQQSQYQQSQYQQQYQQQQQGDRMGGDMAGPSSAAGPSNSSAAGPSTAGAAGAGAIAGAGAGAAGAGMAGQHAPIPQHANKRLSMQDAEDQQLTENVDGGAPWSGATAGAAAGAGAAGAAGAGMAGKQAPIPQHANKRLSMQDAEDQQLTENVDGQGAGLMVQQPGQDTSSEALSQKPYGGNATAQYGKAQLDQPAPELMMPSEDQSTHQRQPIAASAASHSDEEGVDHTAGNSGYDDTNYNKNQNQDFQYDSDDAWDTIPSGRAQTNGPSQYSTV